MRNNWTKRILCALICLIWCQGSTALAQAYTVGTYEATVKGMHGDITMQMVFSDEAIESAEMIACRDTLCIAEPAAQKMTEDAVKFQTVKVDSCSGATVSSRAIRAAMEDCVEQAGGDIDAMAQVPAATKVEHEDENYDVVIVGAGMSGINAAIAAATVDGDSASQSDLSILVIEKLPFAGGSFIVSGAGIYCIYGSEMHKNGQLDTITEDNFVRYLNERSGENFAQIANEPLQRKMYQTILPAEELMIALGAPFTFDMTVVDPMGIQGEGYSDNAFGNLNFDNWTIPFVEEHGYYGTVGDMLGDEFIGMLEKKDNITLRLNTEATGLIVEDGAVVGVNVKESNFDQDSYAEYAIHAKKVILATGSSNLNYEQMTKYKPDFYELDFTRARPFSAGGATGDGITMVVEAGLDPSVIGWGGMCYNGVSDDFGMEDGLTMMLTGAPAVNLEGKRYYNESGTNPFDTGRHTMMQTDNTTYFIVDSNNPAFNSPMPSTLPSSAQSGETVRDYALRMGWAVKADTLEELAQLLDIPVDTFLETISTFNDSALNGTPDEMGSDPASLVAVQQAPFYALINHAYRVEAYVGLQTAPGSTQIVRADGMPIKNLYGCGTLISSNTFTDNYYQFCGGLTTAMSLGNIAGNEVRDAIVGK